MLAPIHRVVYGQSFHFENLPKKSFFYVYRHLGLRWQNSVGSQVESCVDSCSVTDSPSPVTANSWGYGPGGWGLDRRKYWRKSWIGSQSLSYAGNMPFSNYRLDAKQKLFFTFIFLLDQGKCFLSVSSQPNKN